MHLVKPIHHHSFKYFCYIGSVQKEQKIMYTPNKERELYQTGQLSNKKH
jgi:hypothetical protein